MRRKHWHGPGAIGQYLVSLLLQEDFEKAKLVQLGVSV